jgi:hypothetical protein
MNQGSQRRVRGSAPYTDNLKLDAVNASELASFNVYTGVMGSIKVVEGIIYKKLSLMRRLRRLISFLSSQRFGALIEYR